MQGAASSGAYCVVREHRMRSGNAADAPSWTGVYAILMRSLRAECSRTLSDWCRRCNLRLRLRMP